VERGQGRDHEETARVVLGFYHPKARDELEEGLVADIAEGDPAREAMVVPIIVDDSAVVAPHDAMKPEHKTAMSNNARSLCRVRQRRQPRGWPTGRDIIHPRASPRYYARAQGRSGFGGITFAQGGENGGDESRM